MGDSANEAPLLTGETVVAALSPLPPGSGLVISVRVLLDGASTPAQRAFGRAIQRYADRLAQESGNQEASSRAPGATAIEIIETSVIRAQEALEKRIALEKNRVGPLDAVALAGVPIFSGAAGVIGSYLHGPLSWTAFAATALLACVSVIHLTRKGMG
jgi:hypothetical protein